MFYEMLKAGTGPRTYLIGSQKRISGEADRDWLSANEVAA